MSTSATRSLWSYVHPYRRALGVGACLLFVTNAFDKCIPWMLQHAVDALVTRRLGQVQLWALGVVSVAAVMWVIRTWSRVCVFNVGRDVEYDLRNELLARLHALGPSFYGRMATGEIMSRATNDMGQVRVLVGFGLLNVVNSVFAYTGAIALMSAISVKLTVLAMVTVPLFILATRLLGRALFTQSAASQKALGMLADRVQESLAGIRVVKTFAVEDHELRCFDHVNGEAVRQTMRLVMLRGLMWPALMLISAVGTLMCVWRGGQMVLRGELSVGQFAAFNAYLGQLVWPTIAFGFLLNVVQRGRASYARLREVLDAAPDVVEAPDARPAHPVGAVEIKDLSWSYDGRPTLDGVSMAVSACRSLAVVGRTGSGKSTLAALLPRILPTPRASVFLDGDDVTELRLRHVRNAIGYAQQEPFLFSTTIARNIGFVLDDAASPEALETVRHAARESSILAEIEAMPDGFDTVVGERGVQLSGGQKQRVALARALVGQPRVLVLDDPLSAVDARNEAAILEAIDRAGDGRTVILITHRVAAAARADRIVVIERGHVVEEGTHAELLMRGGYYAKLAARQRIEQEIAAL